MAPPSPACCLSSAVLDGTAAPGRVFGRTLNLEQTREGYRTTDQRDTRSGCGGVGAVAA
ncbi:hypothetical protein [Streptomyces sp. NRRL S-340]|uniref:hypothetical protein n=1 Tax=Streptomyces sp. NRRL S-340 TaxID=1463901 RepID=UPI000A3EAB0F|nr:hypothetical protein [Streptomyces sp. NRRL S-340]